MNSGPSSTSWPSSADTNPCDRKRKHKRVVVQYKLLLDGIDAFLQAIGDRNSRKRRSSSGSRPKRPNTSLLRVSLSKSAPERRLVENEVRCGDRSNIQIDLQV